jgi:hypothetical protein
LAAFATSHDTSSGAVINVQPWELALPMKSTSGSKERGLNSNEFAAAKSIFERFISFWKESVTPGMLSVIKVFAEKEGEKAAE